MASRHRWTEEDDIVGLYLYKYGTDDLGITEAEVLTKLATAQGNTRISEGSMERKTRNYQFLETDAPRSGSHPSRQSMEIYTRYRDDSGQDFTRRVRHILREYP